MQAARPQYDTMYRALPKFRFRQCSEQYIISNELSWTESGTAVEQ